MTLKGTNSFIGGTIEKIPNTQGKIHMIHDGAHLDQSDSRPISYYGEIQLGPIQQGSIYFQRFKSLIGGPEVDPKKM